MTHDDIVIGPQRLHGDLSVPGTASGLVVFAHGSGSSRLSPRNRQVAESLQHRRLGTLLFDLLTADEAADRERVFDIELLAERLLQALHTLELDARTRALPLGLFGASTGAAAALVAAARRPRSVRAVVSRGGRPDLAGDALPRVQAPTLLIVGGADDAVLELNRDALRRLGGERQLEIVPYAGHLFEEPGQLEAVAELAGRWFETRLAVS
jgi:pimeloyl-ACP methyl ester carboxylesterase